MTQTDTNEIGEGPSLTKAEFCRAERISPTYLHQLWREGKGPDFYFVGRFRRISAEARRRWRQARELEAASQAPRSNANQVNAGRASAAAKRALQD
jgi:hypothetical protein